MSSTTAVHASPAGVLPERDWPAHVHVAALRGWTDLYERPAGRCAGWWGRGKPGAPFSRVPAADGWTSEGFSAALGLLKELWLRWDRRYMPPPELSDVPFADAIVETWLRHARADGRCLGALRTAAASADVRMRRTS